ncbi:MAG TPA: hypothetical protein VK211_27665 [Kamptonema sp.]|nr:hypothetical protein [Kamptonema sp.]
MKFAISILSLLMLMAAIKSTFGMLVVITQMTPEHSNIASCKVCESPDGKGCCPP